MKKQLIVGFMGLVYLAFSCAALGFALAAPQHHAVYFVHTAGHSDEYHAAVPAKSAIKAFFAKKPVKTKISTVHPGHFFEAIACSCNDITSINQCNDLPGISNADRIRLHCSLLL